MPYIESLDWDSYLAALTAPGRRVTFDDGATAVLEFIDAGQLRLSSGRVSVRDPAAGHDPEWDSDLVFVTVPPGSYPAQIISAVFEVEGRRVVSGAAVRLKIGENPVASWSPAVGTSLDEASGFGVDAGVGIVLDADQLPLVNDPQFVAFLEETVWTGDVLAGYPATGDRDVIAFGCGMGDGVYPVLLGHDSARNLVEVLIDCELCSWSPEWADIRDGTSA